MNANEAKSKSDSVSTLAADGQYSDIIRLIVKETETGLYRAFVYYNINQEVTHKLEADGYKVTDLCDQGVITFKISW